MEKYFTAIIVSKVPGCSQPQFVKYRNIPPNKIDKLIKFVGKTFPDCDHINLYDKHTKQFERQISSKELSEYGVGHLDDGAGQALPKLFVRVSRQ